MNILKFFKRISFATYHLNMTDQIFQRVFNTHSLATKSRKKKLMHNIHFQKVFLVSSMKWHFLLLFLKTFNCQQWFMSGKCYNSYEQFA